MIISRKLGLSIAQIGFGIAVASIGCADTALATASWQRGYIDSPFVVADGSAIYFLHSVASTFDQVTANPGAVPVADYLPNHHGQNGAFWWNTDLYVSYRTSNGTWSSPENLGDNVNTEDGECCPWVNAEQTVLLFSRESASGNPVFSGSFMATRPSASDPWGVPVKLPGELGDFTRFQNFHLVPSGNLYFEGPLLGNETLFVALSTGVGSWGPATVIAELQEAGVDLTQSWASDDELTLLYNRRTADGNTLLLKSVRADPTASWGAPGTVTTTQFQDPAGQLLWGEPSFTLDQTMFFVRFNTLVPEWTAELLRASVNSDGSYGAPEMLIFEPPTYQEGPSVPCVGCGTLTQAPFPETGSWYNPDQSGSGVSMEIQNGVLVGYYYGYGLTGNAIWYLFSGLLVRSTQSGVQWELDTHLQLFQGGSCLGCVYQPPQTPTEGPAIRLEFLQRNHMRLTIGNSLGQFFVPIIYGSDGRRYFSAQTPYVFPNYGRDDIVAAIDDLAPFVFIYKPAPDSIEPYRWSSEILGIADAHLVGGQLHYSFWGITDPPIARDVSLGEIVCKLSEQSAQPGCEISVNGKIYVMPIGQMSDSRFFGEAADGSTVEAYRVSYD